VKYDYGSQLDVITSIIAIFFAKAIIAFTIIAKYFVLTIMSIIAICGYWHCNNCYFISMTHSSVFFFCDAAWVIYRTRENKYEDKGN
jgi:hypothetical protein